MTANAGSGDADDRRDLYAEGSAVLDQDEHVAGAEALFDQALTNGLLAIVSATWPGAVARWDGKPKAADGLLKVIEDQVGVSAAGVALIETDEEATELAADSTLVRLGTKKSVPVNVAQLRAAVDRTQVARHGRGPGQQVTRDDVDALLELDDHPALQALSVHYLDEEWRRGRVASRNEWARAQEYLDLLDRDEVARRAEVARYDLTPAPGDVETPAQECPICGRKAIESTGSDELGYGFTAGTCLVCSYRRSSFAARDLDLDMEWNARWADS